MTRTTIPHGRRALGAACALALIALGGADAQARLGDLDPSFDGDGVAAPAIGAQAGLRAVAIPSDGGIVAGGTVVAAGQPAMLVLRLTDAGVLDASFGGTGVVVPPGNIEDGAIAALAAEPGGNVLAAGGTAAGSIETNPDARLFRITRQGTPTPIGLQLPAGVTNSFLTGVARLADGSIVLGGWATDTGRDKFLAMRLQPDGQPDPGFGANGVAFADFGVGFPARAAGLTVDGLGRITLVGQVIPASGTPAEAAAARFTSGGGPDPAFNGTGQLRISYPAPFAGASRFIAGSLRGDTLLAAGSLGGGTQGVLQALLNGGADPSHGVAGPAGASLWQTGPQTSGEAVATTSIGGAVVAGRSDTGNAATLHTAWFTPSGAPDPAGGGLRAQPVALLPGGPPVGLASTAGDGTVVAVTSPGPTPVVARFLPNAAPTAALTAPAQAAVGAPVTFDAGGSSDPEGEPLRYAFDLDGNGSFEHDAGGVPLATRSFPSAGTFTVGVRVTDPRGADAVATRAIAVATAAARAPRPVLGKQGVARALRGIVRIRLPGKRRFVRLEGLAAIPNGTEIDASRGRVLLTVVRNTKGKLDSARFYAGRFIFRQAKGRKPVTTLRLSGGKPTACGAQPASIAAADGGKKRVRRLWGDGRGRFRTRGRYGAATVRGTKWLTRDRCDGTLVRVVRGKVAVLDLAAPSPQFRDPGPAPVGGGEGGGGSRTTVVKAGERTLVRASGGR